MTSTCGTLIDGLECWQFILMMSTILLLLIIPLISWIVRQKLKNKQSKKEAVPPLMYITAVSATRTSDVDIPHLPSPGETNFLPPSYEDICNKAATANHLSVSTMSLNVDDELADFTAVGSKRNSMVLSTFYSDANSIRMSETADSLDSQSEEEAEVDSDRPDVLSA